MNKNGLIWTTVAYVVIVVQQVAIFVHFIYKKYVTWQNIAYCKQKMSE